MFIRSGIRVLVLTALLLATGAVFNATLAINNVSSSPQARSANMQAHRLFATSANLGIVEIDHSTGAVLRTFAAPVNAGVGDGLAFDGTYLYYLSGSWAPSTLYTLNPTTGSVVMTHTLPAGSFRNGLAYLNGLIYILDWGVLTQDIIVFDPRSGGVVNTLDINGANPGAPLISGGLAGITDPDALLVTTSQTNEVLEINPTTGVIANRFTHGRSGTLGAAVADGLIYLGANTSSVIQMFARNGDPRGSITVTGSIGIQSLGGDDTLGAGPAPTATRTSTQTGTAQPTSTPTATSTVTPSPTATASPTLTPTPTDAQAESVAPSGSTKTGTVGVKELSASWPA